MERPYELIGARLRRLREERGLSIQDVARLLGVSESYIIHLERGTKRPTQLMSFALSELYKIPVVQIDPRVDLPGFEGRDLKDL